MHYKKVMWIFVHLQEYHSAESVKKGVWESFRFSSKTELHFKLWTSAELKNKEKKKKKNTKSYSTPGQHGEWCPKPGWIFIFYCWRGRAGPFPKNRWLHWHHLVEGSVPSCPFKKQFRQSDLCWSQTSNGYFHLVFQTKKWDGVMSIFPSCHDLWNWNNSQWPFRKQKLHLLFFLTLLRCVIKGKSASDFIKSQRKVCCCHLLFH